MLVFKRQSVAKWKIMEIWKNILGYEDLYEVSDLGRIRSKDHEVPCRNGKSRLVRGTVRKPQYNRKGYMIVVLSKENKLKTFTVHQLVAQAFIPGFQKGGEINHKDGNPANPQLINLEVSDPSLNQFHAIRTGLVKKRSVSQYRNVTYLTNPKAKSKWAGSIRHNGKSTYGWKTFMTEVEAAIYVDDLLDSLGDTQRLRNFPKCPTTSP